MPIKEVYVLQLTSDDEEMVVQDGGEVMLMQHDLHGIGCTTSLEGSFTEPNLNVSIGNRDVTDLFHLSIERNPILQESGLTLSVITVRRTLKTSQPDIEMNGQQITCIASVQSGYYDVTASALIVVQCEHIVKLTYVCLTCVAALARGDQSLQQALCFNTDEKSIAWLLSSMATRITVLIPLLA